MSVRRCTFKCGDWNCGSYQFNLYKADIDQGDLCDVHYWQTKAQARIGLTDEELADYLGDEYHNMTTSELRFFRLGEAAAKEKKT